MPQEPLWLTAGLQVLISDGPGKGGVAHSPRLPPPTHQDESGVEVSQEKRNYTLTPCSRKQTPTRRLGFHRVAGWGEMRGCTGAAGRGDTVSRGVYWGSGTPASSRASLGF